jgi:hypothetical protein
MVKSVLANDASVVGGRSQESGVGSQESQSKIANPKSKIANPKYRESGVMFGAIALCKLIQKLGTVLTIPKELLTESFEIITVEHTVLFQVYLYTRKQFGGILHHRSFRVRLAGLPGDRSRRDFRG